VTMLRGMQGKILLLLLFVGLLPLVMTSGLFYQSARNIIVSDRVEIYLKHLSQQNSDKIDLLLMERQEELTSMTSHEVVEVFLAQPVPEGVTDVTQILNTLVKIHEVYDVMVLVDRDGTIRAINTLNRFGDWFDGRILSDVIGKSITNYPEEGDAWIHVLSEDVSVVHDWYSSSLANDLYFFEDDDISRSYHLLFAQPVVNRGTGQVVGVWLNIMNWEYIQAILDLVENDFQKYGLASGSALLLNRDCRKILAASYRKNRRPGATKNYIGIDPSQNTELQPLYNALMNNKSTIHYHLETLRYGGVTTISMDEFGWVQVISLSERDIFKPVTRLTYIFATIIGSVMLLIFFGAWILSRHLIRPITGLKETALDIARGNYTRRVNVRSSDEIGILAKAFNQMAGTIEERQNELEQINRDLEGMVHERTQALQESNRELRQAIQDLQDTQDQLIQAEKMASLGQLIAGIAHEIKNPLNFIYGNTEFLAEYVEKIRQYIAFAEDRIDQGEEGLESIRQFSQDQNLDFIMEDLKNLSINIHDGADRIKSIVNDLRSFARAPSDSPMEADLRKVLDMCLNLLRNQYKNRIRIHREYTEIPLIRVYLGKMEQVFLNLITNAIQAIDAEGDIWVKMGCSQNTVWVEIEDTGRGVPDDIENKIFEPFFSTKDVGEGTGLGLSISYSIVQQHGGAIKVLKRDGGGSIFRVELPLQNLPAPGGEN